MLIETSKKVNKKDFTFGSLLCSFVGCLRLHLLIRNVCVCVCVIHILPLLQLNLLLFIEYHSSCSALHYTPIHRHHSHKLSDINLCTRVDEDSLKCKYIYMPTIQSDMITLL